MKKSKKTVLQETNPNACGIDIGSRSHFVAIPQGRSESDVREFSAFTSGLQEMSAWLSENGIETIAMESTGVYWIPVYEYLESKGFDVKLIDARLLKNVPGRKTDVMDCQWIQQLHSYGLLRAAFRPDDNTVRLRSYIRQRSSLVKNASQYILRMGKALTQMNLLLDNVISDITGVTGMKIIEAIIQGERNPEVLASYRHERCQNSEEVIAESLKGTFREDHLFSLKQSYDLYKILHDKIRECDKQIEKQLQKLPAKTQDLEKVKEKRAKKPKGKKHPYNFDVEQELIKKTGVNLLAIPGINECGAILILSEIGLDMSKWKSSKHFASWLGLCPGNKISGGKRLSGKSKPCSNRAAQALRMAANALTFSKSALGAYFRRLKFRLGAVKAITAAAHKLARIIYNMILHGQEFYERGENYYEEKHKSRVEHSLRKRAKELGFELIPVAA